MLVFFPPCLFICMGWKWRSRGQYLTPLKSVSVLDHSCTDFLPLWWLVSELFSMGFWPKENKRKKKHHHTFNVIRMPHLFFSCSLINIVDDSFAVVPINIVVLCPRDDHYSAFCALWHKIRIWLDLIDWLIGCPPHPRFVDYRSELAATGPRNGADTSTAELRGRHFVSLCTCLSGSPAANHC